jgi:tRNA-dihydrouridine synthase B
MATLTHAGFRTLIGEFGGCDLYFSEMISAEALTNRSPYERYYLFTDPDPDRLVFQLVGYGPESLVEAARLLADTGAAGVDVNMGCSAPHIVRKGGGVAWMQDAARAAETIAAIRRVTDGMSLSAKLRIGDSDDPESLADFALGVQSAGADFITLHPKRRRDGAGRAARWSYIALLRDRLRIPVIGNGGVTGRETLGARVRLAGGGPVMIGRAAARAPWIFDYLTRAAHGRSGEYRVDLLRTATRFFELLEAFQPRDFWPTRARRFVPYLLGNARFGHSTAARLAQTRDYPTIREELVGYFQTHREATVHVESG